MPSCDYEAVGEPYAFVNLDLDADARDVLASIGYRATPTIVTPRGQVAVEPSDEVLARLTSPSPANLPPDPAALDPGSTVGSGSPDGKDRPNPHRSTRRVEDTVIGGFDCVAPDGTHAEPVHFEAETDDGIAEEAMAHIAAYHAALGITDDQARAMVAQGAYDLPAS